MTKRERYDRYFMGVARLTAGMSFASKKKVGCVIVREGRIIATGWNGQPSGFPNACEREGADGRLVTLDTVIHAEANALFWCAKTEIMAAGATAYVTLSPCKNCALGLIQAGIRRVVYGEAYGNADKTGLELLKEAGVEAEELPA